MGKLITQETKLNIKKIIKQQHWLLAIYSNKTKNVKNMKKSKLFCLWLVENKREKGEWTNESAKALLVLRELQL